MFVAVVFDTTGETVINKKVGLLNADSATLSSLWIIISVVTLGIALVESAWAAPGALVVAWAPIDTDSLVSATKKFTVYITSTLANTLKVLVSLTVFSETHLEVAIVATLFANSGLVYMCTSCVKRVPNMLARLRQSR